MREIKTAAVDTDSARFARALRSAILGPVCVILFTAVLLLAMVIVLGRTVKWSEHSYEVITETRAAENSVLDTQSALRRFLLTGDSSFPGSLAARHVRIVNAFDRLGRLVQDNPQQKIRFENLVRTRDLWYDHLKTGVDQKTQSTTQDPGWLKMGIDLVSSIRSQFQDFDDVEAGLHDERINRVKSYKSALVFAGSALALILALTVGQMVRRQFMQLAYDYRTALGTIEQRHAALLRSEADLEKQKEWFRVTLTSIGDGVIVTDKESRVVFMNHESERLTGWNSVEALLKPLASVFRVEDEKRKRVELEELLLKPLTQKKTSGLPSSSVLLSKNGEEWPIEDSSAPIHDAKGDVLGLVVVFRNASEKRKVQNELERHSHSLEERVQERTTALQQTVSELESFSYTVSHDLRSPLRAMQGFAQAVLEDYGGRLDEQGQNYLTRIKNAAERLDRLIQDLLSYTRISRQDAALVPMDLDKLVRELIEHYPNLHPPAAQVTIEGRLPRVQGLEASLTQVFSNLLGNAAKFVQEGVSPQIRVWSEDCGERARIWIEDNGIGISPENYERIFQMFVQVNESQLYGGTGVGLAIVRKAAESMHGSVGLGPAEKGAGTKFWVELAKA